MHLREKKSGALKNKMGKLMLITTDNDLTKEYYEECKKQVLNREVVTSSVAGASSRNSFEVVDSSENYTVTTEKNKYVFPKSISAENDISGIEETEKHFQYQIIENQEKYQKEFLILSEYNKEFKTDFRIHQQMKEIALDYLNNFKNNWCKEHNIPIIRIPYTHYKNLNINHLLKHVLYRH